MFTGTKQLDKILSNERAEKTHRGVVYAGRDDHELKSSSLYMLVCLHQLYAKLRVL